jgi:hypothetical protein
MRSNRRMVSPAARQMVRSWLGMVFGAMLAGGEDFLGAPAGRGAGESGLLESFLASEEMNGCKPQPSLFRI